MGYRNFITTIQLTGRDWLMKQGSIVDATHYYRLIAASAEYAILISLWARDYIP